MNNLIDRGTSPIFQDQNELSPVARLVGISEESPHEWLVLKRPVTARNRRPDRFVRIGYLRNTHKE